MKMRGVALEAITLATLMAVLLSVSPAQATTYATWQCPSSSNSNAWNSGTNWTNPTFPNAAAANAYFESPTAGPYGALNMTANLSTPIKLNNLFFFTPDASGYTVNDSSGTNTITFAKGTCINAKNTGGTNTINAPLILNATNNEFDQSAGGTLVLSGPIGGGASGAPLTLNISGTLILSGANTYADTTTLSAAGVLQLTNPAALGNLNSLTISGGGSLQLRNDTNLAQFVSGGLTVSGPTINIDVDQAQSGTNNTLQLGDISNGGSGITFTNGGGHGYSLNVGTVTLTGATGSTFTNNMSSGGTTSLASLWLTSGAASQTATFSGSGATSVGLINDGLAAPAALSLAVLGSGPVVLNAANTYTGSTTVGGGTLQLGAAGALPANTALTVNNGVLDLNQNSATVSSLNGNGTIVSLAGGAPTLAVGNAGGGGTFSGSITGAIGLTVNGGFALVIGSSSAVPNGPLAVNASTLDLTGKGATTAAYSVGPISLTSATLNLGLTGTSSDTLASSDVITLSGATTINLVGLVGGTSPQLGTYTLLSGTSFDTSGGTLTLGATPVAGFNTWSPLNLSGTSCTISLTGAPAPATAYWSGSLSSTWSDGNQTLNNWRTAATGGSFCVQLPESTTDVYFSALSASNSATTTLGSPFAINSLHMIQAGAMTITDANNALTIEGGGITLSSTAGGLTISTSGLVLGLAQTWTNNAAYPLTVSAALSGGGGLTTSGSGTIVLGGANTAFTGGLTINAGLLQMANGAALSAANAVAFTPLSSGTLQLNGNSVTIGGLSTDLTSPGAPVVTNSNSTPATLTVTTAGVNSYAGTLQDGPGGGALALAMAGSGTLVLAGTNHYSGPTSLGGGTLIVNGSAALGPTSALNVTAASTFQTTSPLALAASVPVTVGANLTVVGSSGIAIGGALTNSGANNTLTNNITASSGTLALNGSIYLSEASGTGRTLLINSSSAAATIINAVISDYSGGPGTSGGSLTLEPNVSGSLIVVNSANTYTGSTLLGGNDLGWIIINNNNAFSSGAVTLSKAALVAGSNSGGAVTLANPVLLSASPNSIEGSSGYAFTLFSTVAIAGTANETLNNNSNGLLTLSGSVYMAVTDTKNTLTLGGTGTGGIVVSGLIANNEVNGTTVGNLTSSGPNQTLTFTGSNAYTGNTSVTAGTLAFSPSCTVSGNGNLTVDGPTSVVYLSNYYTETGSGYLYVENGGVLNVGVPPNIVGTVVNGVPYVSGGTVDWMSTNAVRIGYTKGSGTLNINASGDLIADMTKGNNVQIGYASGSTGVVNVNSGGTLDVDAAPYLYVGNTALSTGSLNVYSGGEVVVSSTAGFVMGGGSAGSGTVNLNGGLINTSIGITGGTAGTSTFNFNGGTLQAGANSSAFISGLTFAIVSSGGAIIDSNGYAITIGQWLQPAPGSTGGLTVNSSVPGGMLTLSGSNSYTGATKLNGGTLQVDNLAALGSGGVVLNAGVLDLNGFPISIPTLNGGTAGTITDNSMGSGITTLTVSNSGNFGGTLMDGANGEQLALTMDGTGTLVLSGSDSYNGGTTVEAGTLIAASNGAIPSGTALIVGAGGTFIFDPNAVLAGPASGNATASPQGIASVPEPGTLALLGVAGIIAAAAAWRRRKGS